MTCGSISAGSGKYFQTKLKRSVALRGMKENSGKRFIVLEGYDGSGKSTIINALRTRLSERSTRVVGRKNEPELADISKILERDDLRPDPKVEMLLRIASEVERQNVITRSLSSHEVVLLGRGVVSLVSWFDYLDVSRRPYEPLLKRLREFHQNALTVVCRAAFETCLERSSIRSEQSQKDRLGKDVNRRYFRLYEANVESHAKSGSDIVFINTVGVDVTQSTELVLEALESRGL
jgi:thymidylate kinase